MPMPTEQGDARLQRSIQRTMENIVHTNNCIIYAQDRQLKARLKAKNDRRIDALEKMHQSLRG